MIFHDKHIFSSAYVYMRKACCLANLFVYLFTSMPGCVVWSIPHAPYTNWQSLLLPSAHFPTLNQSGPQNMCLPLQPPIDAEPWYTSVVCTLVSAHVLFIVCQFHGRCLLPVHFLPPSIQT